MGYVESGPGILLRCYYFMPHTLIGSDEHSKDNNTGIRCASLARSYGPPIRMSRIHFRHSGCHFLRFYAILTFIATK